jgi:hypothetical protein
MDELTLSWVNAAKRAVEIIQENYKINRGLLLTEGDLECHLFAELLKQDGLNRIIDSKSGRHLSRDVNGKDFKTTFVHSQVTWFKPDAKSGFEVDITISDPAKLEVKNIELFGQYTSKGFAYDGECVAIEVKFIRQEGDAQYKAQEDYLKFRDKLIPSKLENINNGVYQISNADNIAFISIVGCKDKETFVKAKHYIGKHLSAEGTLCPENLLICVFYQDDIVWDKDSLIIEFKSLNKVHNL